MGTRKTTSATQSKTNPSSISKDNSGQDIIAPPVRKPRQVRKGGNGHADTSSLEQHRLAGLKPSAREQRADELARLLAELVQSKEAVQGTDHAKQLLTRISAEVRGFGDAFKGLIRTSELPWILPRGRNGAVVNASTIYRWKSKGVRGRVLRVTTIAGVGYVHINDLLKFFGLTEAPIPPPASVTHPPTSQVRTQTEAERRLAEEFGV